MSLLDEDDDPMVGDLGKVDLPGDDPSTAGEAETGFYAGAASNCPTGDAFDDVGKFSDEDGGNANDGALCDAMWSQDACVAFIDGTFDCETTRIVTVSCTWDADGGINQGRAPALTTFDPTTATNLAGFLRCRVEQGAGSPAIRPI